ncbi:MAG: mOMP-like family protein [Parachlamydiales bacterium]|nr:mOMP-like family protein [Parachlamydiales bacterium]
MKKHILFLCALALTNLTADENCSTLPSSRPCVRGDLPDQTNMYTRISFLYWQCAEKGLDFALINTQPQFNSKLTSRHPSFQWDPAFRLLLGTHLPIDNWSIDLGYSIFYQDVRDEAHHSFDINSDAAFGSGILSVWTSPGAFLSNNIYARWQSAFAKWKIHAHFLDLMLRHDLALGYALSFQPSFGLKMAMLQQRYVLSYSPGNIVYLPAEETLLSSTVNMNNRSFNLGPGAGCSTRWCLSPRWNLFGSLSGALLGAHFQVGRNEFDVSSTASTIIGSYRISDRYWTYRPQAALSFGMQWSDCSCSKTSSLHYGFSASYEAQYWWRQNMMLRHYDAPAAQSHTMSPVQGDLFFQGLTVDALFDF